MRLRIGINLGDVMVKDGDIFGDGVNVAARIEGLVKGGEICVSRGVRDHLRHRGGMVFEDLGEQLVKNIAHPIRAFRLRLGQDTSTPEAPIPGDADESPEIAPAPAALSELSADNEVALELALWDSVKDGSPGELDPTWRSIPKAPLPHSPAPGSMQRRGRLQVPPRRHPRKSPRRRSILRSGIPSRTATEARSFKPTSNNIRMVISPGLHERVFPRRMSLSDLACERALASHELWWRRGRHCRRRRIDRRRRRGLVSPYAQAPRHRRWEHPSTTISFLELLRESKCPYDERDRIEFDNDRIAAIAHRVGPAGAPTAARWIVRLPQRRVLRPCNWEEDMGRGILLWLLGVPIPIIILLALIWH